MRRKRRWWGLRFWLCCFVLPGLAASAVADAASTDPSRLALVIGNSAYRARRLPTAGYDAGLVAQSLVQAGYDVTAMGDTDAATLRKTVSVFTEKVRGAGGTAIVFVYLSGYGLQYDGDNVLVPVDAKIDRQADVSGASVPLAEIQRAIDAVPAKVRIFVADLAREHPFAKTDVLPLAAGLAIVAAPPGWLNAFNAAPGSVARNDTPPYGLYARALAETLRTPHLAAQTMFARIRLRVAGMTGGADVPWDDTNLDSDVELVPGEAAPLTRMLERPIEGQPVEAAYWTAIAADRLETYQAFARAFPAESVTARVKLMIAVRLEALTWSESLRVGTPAAYWTYMQRYPRGPHYVDVRRRLADIHAALEPPSRFEPYDFARLPPPTPEQVRAIDQPDLLLEDSVATPIPHVTDGLLPPPSPAIYVDLALPPLVPKGVLPIPAFTGTPGTLLQPFVPGLGAVSVDTDAQGTMTLSVDGEAVTRTTTSSDKSTQTILQTSAADEIVSKTTVTHSDGSLVTIQQTGPRGDLLSSIVTRIDALGERTTTVSNADGQLVAETRANRWGVIGDVTSGTAALDDPTFMLPSSEIPPAASPAQAPKVMALPPPSSNAPFVLPTLEPAPRIEPAEATPLTKPADTMPTLRAAGSAPPAKPATAPPPAQAEQSQPIAPQPAARPEETSKPPENAPMPIPRPPALTPRHRATHGRRH